jgi:hypothetical protein
MDYSSSSQMQLTRPIIEEPDDSTPQQSQLVQAETRKHQSPFEQFQMRSEPNGKMIELAAEMASLRAELNSMKHKNQLLWNHLANLEQHNQTLLKEDAKNNKKIDRLISIVEQILGKNLN